MHIGKRTHTCGELRASDEAAAVRLKGWVHRVRDKGGLLFLDLRDRYGITQVTFNADRLPDDVMGAARGLRHEFVVGVRGTVAPRPPEMRNPDLPTGEIEVLAEQVEILNESKVPPFVLDSHASASEDLRLEFRYLDLRRPELQRVIELRNRACQACRRFLDTRSFLEIETPILVRPTPEGARDYLVPSRIRAGHFYALPQSPQLYKQLLMISGFDRYYQIARCMRDEDLRADRQPEFSQIDMEMSFVDEEDVYEIVESMIVAIVGESVGVPLDRPFPRLSYRDAMDRYGSDKPDVRFSLEISDVTAPLRGTKFQAFADAIAAGAAIKALRVPAEHALSRKVLDELEGVVKRLGAKGLAWSRVAGGRMDGGIARFLSEPEQHGIIAALSARDSDTVLIVGSRWATACAALGAVRQDLGRRFGLAGGSGLRFLWVTDFPLFERDAETSALVPSHHVFTMPKDSDLGFLDTDPERVHASLYDLVLNGVELGSGSIRVHRRGLQEKLLALIGIGREEAERRFGFLLRALEYGAPPHGGIALGLERLIMVLAGRTSIRDTIAFPKTTTAACLMDGSPAAVGAEELQALHLSVLREETPAE
jgi:aspartyl-tRNA synthetase